MNIIIKTQAFRDELTIRVLNGKFEGQTGHINNTYYASQADSEKFNTNRYFCILINIQVMRILLKKA